MKSKKPWAGINSNERQINSVHNALVSIVLDGVVGVSPEHPGHEWRMVPSEKADQFIERGRQVLANLESQSPAPRGHARRWMEHNTAELKRLLADAEAVRAGSRPQKMTPDDYEALRKSLGVHEAPHAEAGGKQATKPGKHGTLKLWLVTYTDADNPAFGESSFRTWAYDQEAAALAFQENNEEDSWEIVKIEPVLDTGPKRLSKEPHAVTEKEYIIEAEYPPGSGSYSRFPVDESWPTKAQAEKYGKRWFPASQNWRVVPIRGVRETPVVADFNTIDDLVKHARGEGATHVSNPSGVGSETKLYFPLRDGGYAEASVWRKEGYWHTQAPSVRARVAKLPAEAQRIGRSGGRAAEPHLEAHRTPPDEQAAHELVLFIENESDLSPDGPSGQGRSVLLNALRKWRSGTYDSTRAVQLFAYLAEAGAKRYAKEFGSSEKEWSTMFTPATRHEAARQLEASFRNSAEQGEYDKIDTGRGARETVETHVEARRGDSKPKYRPSKAWHTIKVDRVVPSHGGNRVEFEDGFSIQVHGGSGRSDLLYAMKPTDMRFENRSQGPERRREYQYAALKAVLGDQQADFVVDHDGDVMAYLKEGAVSETPHVHETDEDAHQGARETARSGTTEAPHTRETDEGAHQAGADYVQKQVESDHFQDWVRQQLIEASRMDPSEVLPLETKADAKVIARNMLQDLEHDTQRQYTPDVEDTKAFWAGFREALRSSETRDWLADELLRMKGEMSGGVRENVEARSPIDLTAWYIDAHKGEQVTHTSGPFSSKKEAAQAARRRSDLSWGAPYQGMDMGHKPAPEPRARAKRRKATRPKAKRSAKRRR